MIPRSTTRSHSSVRTMSSSPIIAAGDVAVLLGESNGDERLPTSANDVEQDNERFPDATKEPGGRQRHGLRFRYGMSPASTCHLIAITHSAPALPAPRRRQTTLIHQHQQ